MPEITNLSWGDVQELGIVLYQEILNYFNYEDVPIRLYGVPRGGIYVALLLKNLINAEEQIDNWEVVESPSQATVFVDDIIDSGETKNYYNLTHPNKPFFALIHRIKDGAWVSFPWERMTNESGPLENVKRLLEYIGEDPKREGLLETPKRVIKSYETLFGGYKKNPQDVIKVFEDGACNEMVLLKDIEFYSNCEHHMLPFFGKAHIAYIPDGRVIGVSKLARVLGIYARRLQIQERLGQQVTQCLMDVLKPKGAACVLEAQHLCMLCRGVEKQNSVMITSSLTGVFLEHSQTRGEFLSMIK